MSKLLPTKYTMTYVIDKLYARRHWLNIIISVFKLYSARVKGSAESLLRHTDKLTADCRGNCNTALIFSHGQFYYEKHCRNPKML